MPKELRYFVGLWEVLAGSAFPLDQIRHGIQPETIHPDHARISEPLFAHGRIVVVEVGLVAEKAVPVVRL